jgi:drug/metabolite transporter (DMT)-like permease
LVATIFWGMTFAFIKEAVEDLNPYAFNFYRFVIAAVLLIILYPKLLRHLTKEAISCGIILGILLGLTVLLQTVGLQYVTASAASFITGMAVIFVMLYSSIAAQKLPDKKNILGVFFSITGLALITLQDGLQFSIGEALILLCAASFAAYIFLCKHLLKGQNVISVTSVQLMTIAVMSLIGMSLSSEIQIPADWTVWRAILFTSIFATIVAFALQLHYQKYISAQKVAIIFAMEPVFATITAVIYLNEQLDKWLLLGGPLIILSMLITR